jgi:hypothetical protein
MHVDVQISSPTTIEIVLPAASSAVSLCTEVEQQLELCSGSSAQSAEQTQKTESKELCHTSSVSTCCSSTSQSTAGAIADHCNISHGLPLGGAGGIQQDNMELTATNEGVENLSKVSMDLVLENNVDVVEAQEKEVVQADDLESMFPCNQSNEVLQPDSLDEMKSCHCNLNEGSVDDRSHVLDTTIKAINEVTSKRDQVDCEELSGLDAAASSDSENSNIQEEIEPKKNEAEMEEELIEASRKCIEFEEQSTSKPEIQSECPEHSCLKVISHESEEKNNLPTHCESSETTTTENLYSEVESSTEKITANLKAAEEAFSDAFDDVSCVTSDDTVTDTSCVIAGAKKVNAHIIS